MCKTQKHLEKLFMYGYEYFPLFNAQIREQMCLQTHFQYEFSFLGHFGQLPWELAEQNLKKGPNASK